MKKQNRLELFKSEDIEVSCPKKMVWDEMDIVRDGRRHCEGCDKILFDVTGYSKQEVVELQKKHGNICVAVTNTVIASSVALSLAACSSTSVVVPKKEVKVVQEQVVSTKKIKDVNETVVMVDEEVTVVGIFDPLPNPIYEVLTEEVNGTQQEVYLPVVPYVPIPVTVGLPARRVVPCPSFAKRMLNNMKDFFGVGEVEHCYDY
jgi:hypothetical protein